MVNVNITSTNVRVYIPMLISPFANLPVFRNWRIYLGKYSPAIVFRMDESRRLYRLYLFTERCTYSEIRPI